MLRDRLDLPWPISIGWAHPTLQQSASTKTGTVVTDTQFFTGDRSSAELPAVG